MAELALDVSTDPEHKFDLAVQLKKLEVASEIAKEADSETKWRQLGDLSLGEWKVRTPFLSPPPVSPNCRCVSARPGRHIPEEGKGFRGAFAPVFCHSKCQRNTGACSGSRFAFERTLPLIH